MVKYFLLRETRKGVISNVNAEESETQKAVPKTVKISNISITAALRNSPERGMPEL